MDVDSPAVSFGPSFQCRLTRLFTSVFRRVRVSSEDRDAYQANTSKLTTRLVDVMLRTFDLGFTAFGGPPVHFQIFHRRFVDGHGKTPWIDEQTVSLDFY